MNSKHISDYWVERLPNGIIHLLFNTHERWIGFHAYNDSEYKFWSEIDWEGAPLDADVQKIEGMEEILAPLRKGSFRSEGAVIIRAVQQEKDQISFYFIPHEKEWIKNREIILESKK